MALTALAPSPVGNNPYSAAVGDLNQDGTPDLVVSNCFSNNIGVLLSGTQISVPYSDLRWYLVILSTRRIPPITPANMGPALLRM